MEVIQETAVEMSVDSTLTLEEQLELKEKQKDADCLSEVNAVLAKYNRLVQPVVIMHNGRVMEERVEIIRKPKNP